jgi:hypothetical protein
VTDDTKTQNCADKHGKKYPADTAVLKIYNWYYGNG